MGSSLKVSDNGRFLAHRDGSPFFYLGDTAWEIYHRLSREEIDHYLQDRAAKDFTVIQTVLLSEINGLSTPNYYGDLPLIDLDPTRPNEPYFQVVDHLVERAEKLGLFVGILPTWGAYTVEEKHVLFPDHFIFNPDNAFVYGRFLGERYRDKSNIIWIMGGDRKPDGYEETWRSMARGIAVGTSGEEDYSQTLMTYHPWGGKSSGEWFHHEPWLSFNMIQSGHHRDNAPYEMIERDYARTPVKPVLNGEPGYERIPNNLSGSQPKLDDHDMRKYAYWSLFAGACGHTYGANELWMIWKPEHDPVSPKLNGPLLDADTPWNEALQYPGARQMQHARALIESRPFFTRIPDPSLLVSDAGTGGDHVQACRDTEGRYAFVYVPSGKPVTVDLSRLSGQTLRASWYDPRNGSSQPIGEFKPVETTFTPPSSGPDWVLVADDVAQNYPLPGVR